MATTYRVTVRMPDATTKRFRAEGREYGTGVHRVPARRVAVDQVLKSLRARGVDTTAVAVMAVEEV